MKKLEQTDQIMGRIFDPRIKCFNTYVDPQKKQIHKYIPLNIKLLFIENFLMQNWENICGKNLAKNCSVDKLNGSTLTIRTRNSLFANELYMMKALLLKKINTALSGSMEIEELKFYAGGLLKREKPKIPLQEEEKKPITIVQCPQCGAKMASDNKICSVCERENKEKLQEEIMKLLKVQPWLRFEDCQSFIACDRSSFTIAKDILQDFYFEQVRLGYANVTQEYMAVMFLTGKSIDKLDENLIKNSLEFLRRKQDVSTSGV